MLARQLLLERSPASVPAALERVAGIQAQYAPSMYIGLWSRVAGFDRERLTRALERRGAVQGTLMRSTIHLVSRRDYWPFALATRAARRRRWLAGAHGGTTDDQMAAAAREVRPHLAGRALARAALEDLVGRTRAAGIGLWLDLVRAPPSGTWEHRRADLYAAAEEWIGPPAVPEDEALDHLVRRYLAAFGPAPRADIVAWTGLTQGALAPSFGRMRLRRFRDEDGRELLDLPRAPLPPADTPAPVRYLPPFDATLMGHARRAGILPDEHRARVFPTTNGTSLAPFLVDGVVGGVWRHRGGRIDLEPFVRLGAADRRALDEEAGALAALHAAS